MSDFLVNVAQRGAGLAPLVKVQPPFIPTFAPGNVAARPAEPDAAPGPADVRSPKPLAPVQGETPPLTAQAEALSPRSQPAQTMTPPPLVAVPTEPPTPPHSPPLQVDAPPTGTDRAAEPGQAVETATATVVSPQAAPLPRHPQPPALIVTPAPVTDSAIQTPMVERPGPAPDRPSTSPGLPVEAETDPLPRPAAVHPALTQEPYDRAEMDHPQPIIRSTNQLANQAPTQPTIHPAIQPAIAAERPLALPKPGMPAMPPEPRPIQVRIGTVEVRATTPPPSPPSPPPASAPVSRGFDDYVHIRTYVNWER